jgi:predicted TIM-barrel fold metal-dependent hydrolase
VSSAVDFHQHVWTDAYRRLLERRTAAPYLRGRRLVLPCGGSFSVDPDAHTPERRLAELDDAGLDVALVSLPPTCEPTADLVEAWHDDALQLEAATEGRLVPLAYCTARPPFVGAIVPAPLLHRSAKLLERLQEQSRLAFVHPSASPPLRPAWRTPGVGYTQQMLDAYSWWIAFGAARFPRLQIVFALLAGGAPFHLERFARRGLDTGTAFVPNLWFETSSYGEQALELSVATFGAERLLFGSDAPVDRVQIALSPVRALGSAIESALLRFNPGELLARGREGEAGQPTRPPVQQLA